MRHYEHWLGSNLSTHSTLQLNLSPSIVPDTASVGTTVGTLSVSGGTGVYTYTLISNPGSLFSISGSFLKVAASLAAGLDPITIHADNGAGSTVSTPFTIVVTHTSGSYVPTYFFLGF